MLGKANIKHFGEAPGNVINIRATAGNQKVTLFWQDPNDSKNAIWKGTKVVQKVGSYPTSIYDGTLIIDNQIRNAYNEAGFTITGLTNGVTYYYAFFPYSDEGIINKNEVNRITAKPFKTKIYGIRRSLFASSSSWERLEDAIGLQANATHNGSLVTNDFDNIYPWSDIISYNYDINTKQPTAYYGDSTFKFKNSSPYTLVLTKIPEFWYKRYQKDNYEYIYISADKIDGYTKSEEFSIGRYASSISSVLNHLTSNSGETPSTSTAGISLNVDKIRERAKQTGSNFALMDWRYFILQILYLVEYADYDSQKKLGQGNINSNTVNANGACDALGMKSGCLSDNGSSSVIYRGIENIFGNVPQVIDGIAISESNFQIYTVCNNPSDYENYNKYTQMSDKILSLTGYISKLTCDSNIPIISLPIDASASSNTGTCDYLSHDIGRTVILVGGSSSKGTSNNGSKAGLWSMETIKKDSEIQGARLLKY